MVIQSSNAAMSSRRHYLLQQEEGSSMVCWGSPENEEKIESASQKTTKKIQGEENPYKGKTIHQIQSEVIQYLLDLFFGEGETWKPWNQQMWGRGTSGSVQEYGGTITKSSFYYESETTQFETTGTVVTADGRELEFHVEVQMTRAFSSYMEEHINFGAPKLCDPLVINLDTNIAEVSDQKFLFDMDADGSEDCISTLKKGSGFLALDLNGNGRIDDGSELFGAKSGDGFSDLEEYDMDKNGWIDEADEVFDKLRIWIKDESGNDKLVKLKEAGVGAICLKNAQTQFSLNSRWGNRTNAYIRKTGIFLYENGTAGTVQHLDLVQ